MPTFLLGTFLSTPNLEGLIIFVHDVGGSHYALNVTMKALPSDRQPFQLIITIMKVMLYEIT